MKMMLKIIDDDDDDDDYNFFLKKTPKETEKKFGCWEETKVTFIRNIVTFKETKLYFREEFSVIDFL